MFRIKKTIKTILIKFSLRKKRKIFIGKDVQIIGYKNILFGQNIFISDGVWMNVNKRDLSKRLRIGNNSFIGRNNFFTVGESITLGDYFFSSIGCKFIGASHENNPFYPFSLSTTTTDKKIEIGPNVFLGANVTIIGNLKIGYGSIIGANSVVLHDIPPLSIAVGNPARVIKRFCLEKKEWIDANLFENNTVLSEKEYMNLLRQVELSYDRFCYAYTRGDYL